MRNAECGMLDPIRTSLIRYSVFLIPHSAFRIPHSIDPLQSLAQLPEKLPGVPFETMIARLYDRNAFRLPGRCGEHPGFVQRHVLILARLDQQVGKRRDLPHIAASMESRLIRPGLGDECYV